jgi:hypothetical protein
MMNNQSSIQSCQSLLHTAGMREAIDRWNDVEILVVHEMFVMFKGEMMHSYTLV